jgi:NAD(P)-dependent dehydrogenase (short-subunit alcohol dehydrogenase family)
VPGDVTRLEEVRSAYARIKADWGPVDVAFLNAGIGQFMPLRRFSAADVQRTLEVNVTGVANGLEVLLPDMLERRGGTIVGTSSLGRYLGFPRSSSYSASKAALSLLLQGVRIEARRYHVRVVTFEPGFVRTPMTAKNKFKMPFSMEADAAAERLCRAVAAGRTVVRFPHLMSIVARLAVILPDAVVERTLSVIRSH